MFATTGSHISEDAKQKHEKSVEKPLMCMAHGNQQIKFEEIYAMGRDNCDVDRHTAYLRRTTDKFR